MKHFFTAYAHTDRCNRCSIVAPPSPGSGTCRVHRTRTGRYDNGGTAALAGINKERLYNYFGDKRLLFETVLTEELEKLAVSLGANAPGLEDVGEYTGCIFDYHARHPQLVRLLLWEGLSDGLVVNEATRTAHYQRTVAMFAAAQRDGVLNDDLDPAKLVFPPSLRSVSLNGRQVPSTAWTLCVSLRC